jgi:hypothetical protein
MIVPETLAPLCPPNTDVTVSAICRCYCGGAAGGARSPNVAQRPIGARLTGTRGTRCLPSERQLARLADTLSPGPGPGQIGRWGDYGAATVDAATGFFYFGNEYIPDPTEFPPGSFTNWGTFITRVH